MWTAQVTERGRSLFDVQADMASTTEGLEPLTRMTKRYIEL